MYLQKSLCRALHKQCFSDVGNVHVGSPSMCKTQGPVSTRTTSGTTFPLIATGASTQASQLSPLPVLPLCPCLLPAFSSPSDSERAFENECQNSLRLPGFPLLSRCFHFSSKCLLSPCDVPGAVPGAGKLSVAQTKLPALG